MKKQNKNKNIKMVENSGFEPLTSSMPWTKPINQGPRRSRLQTLSPSRRYVIPAGFSLIPAITWDGGVPAIFHILCEDVNAGRGKDVKPRRAKKGA